MYHFQISFNSLFPDEIRSTQNNSSFLDIIHSTRNKSLFRPFTCYNSSFCSFNSEINSSTPKFDVYKELLEMDKLPISHISKAEETIFMASQYDFVLFHLSKVCWWSVSCWYLVGVARYLFWCPESVSLPSQVSDMMDMCKFLWAGSALIGIHLTASMLLDHKLTPRELLVILPKLYQDLCSYPL